MSDSPLESHSNVKGLAEHGITRMARVEDSTILLPVRRPLDWPSDYCISIGSIWNKWQHICSIPFNRLPLAYGVLYCFVHLLYIRSDIIVTHIVRSSQGPVYSSSTWHSLHPCRANKQIWRNDRTGRKNVLLHQQIFSLFFTCLYLKQVKRILCIL